MLLFSVIFGTSHLAQPGLTAGCLVGWLSGRQNADKCMNFYDHCRFKVQTIDCLLC